MPLKRKIALFPCLVSFSLFAEAFHNEAVEMYYSENHFLLSINLDEDGTPFLNLHRAARKAMTSLTIALGEWWGYSHCQRKYKVDSRGKFHEMERTDKFNETLRRFKVAISQLAADVQESLLGLSISFSNEVDLEDPEFKEANITEADVKEADAKEAQSIIAAMEVLPKLKNCALLFRFLPSPDLTRLAQKSVLKMITPKPDKTYEPFQFLKLPLEIQLEVLSYTDLVCPNDIKFKINSFVHKSEHCCGTCSDALLHCFCPPNTGATT